MSALLVFTWLISTTSGQFFLERGSSCSDGSLLYSCTTSTSFSLTWRFQPSGARNDIANGSPSPQAVFVGSSRVLLTIISSNNSFISVTALIAYSDAVGLNGTSIQCGIEDMLIINVPNVKLNLPALLKIRQIENTIMIDPTPNINGVIYSVTSSNNITTKGILNDSAFLIEESDADFYFNVSFICIETSIIFNIGPCIAQDYNENLTYTLFPDVYWEITCFNDSIVISDVRCMTDGNWSVPSPCLVSSLTTTDTAVIWSMTDSNSSETSCGCANVYVYVIAPLIAIFFALVVNILVMAICFTKIRKRKMEDLSNTLSAQIGNNRSQEGCAVNLVDNVAYECIAPK